MFLLLAEIGIKLYGILVSPSSEYPGAFERVGFGRSYLTRSKLPKGTDWHEKLRGRRTEYRELSLRQDILLV